MVGLFTKNVPALGAKIAITFHVLAYALLKFPFSIDLNPIGIDLILNIGFDVQLNFIHVYAVLFFIEIFIMLTVGYLKPVKTQWHYQQSAKVDLTPWRYALPASSTMLTCIIVIYLLFSPLGLVGGFSPAFYLLFTITIFANIIFCFFYLSKNPYPKKPKA